ncbi:MAG: hypothetical protein B6D46_06615 [Polyangiaceae bacterium UTPRO1]|jgi:hypothetical protein|nr:hypothetical protein [Dehalococcoidia bacterium]MEB2283422.1 hypothetical protein [Myxococcales bacterium]OQY67698.1 MAG: hypothetical protein B6D46_06615 [Polyangiaceae bacterium UTPRO1]
MTGREALLLTFDRLFDKAAKKLSVTCTDTEKNEARRRFEERFSMLLEALRALEIREIPEEVVVRMEEAIEKLSPADIVGLLATVPLVPQAQEMMRLLAYRAAEQRLLEHYVATASDRFGGH